MSRFQTGHIFALTLFLSLSFGSSLSFGAPCGALFELEIGKTIQIPPAELPFFSFGTAPSLRESAHGHTAHFSTLGTITKIGPDYFSQESTSPNKRAIVFSRGERFSEHERIEDGPPVAFQITSVSLTRNESGFHYSIQGKEIARTPISPFKRKRRILLEFTSLDQKLKGMQDGKMTVSRISLFGKWRNGFQKVLQREPVPLLHAFPSDQAEIFQTESHE